jgi:hypothetical protein
MMKIDDGSYLYIPLVHDVNAVTTYNRYTPTNNHLSGVGDFVDEHACEHVNMHARGPFPNYRTYPKDTDVSGRSHWRSSACV